jgi:hypothetical protein
MAAGSAIAGRVSAERLRRTFAWAVVTLGSVILAQQVLSRAGLV